MISRAHRFHGHNSLNYVYRHGKTAHTPDVNLKTIVNKQRQSYRVAVVVSKKVSKSAVVRNRIRRKLYEAVRQSKNVTNQPYDMVFTVFNVDLAKATKSDVETIVATLFRQAGIH